MASRSRQTDFSRHLPDLAAPPQQSRMKPKAFLTTVMALLSILVFGLGFERRNMLWMWIGFVCALVAGIFVQLFIDRRKKEQRSL